MKTLTAVEYLFQLIDDFGIEKIDRKAILKMEKEQISSRLEALRSELKDEFNFDHQLEIIDEVINNRLNELK